MVYVDDEYYYAEDRDVKKANEYQRQYYYKNKEKLNNKEYRKNYKSKYSIMMNCDCGGRYLHPFNTKRHKESKKHKEYVFLHNDLSYFN